MSDTTPDQLRDEAARADAAARAPTAPPPPGGTSGEGGAGDGPAHPVSPPMGVEVGDGPAAGTVDRPVHPGEAQNAAELGQNLGGPVDVSPLRRSNTEGAT